LIRNIVGRSGRSRRYALPPARRPPHGDHRPFLTSSAVSTMVRAPSGVQRAKYNLPGPTRAVHESVASAEATAAVGSGRAAVRCRGPAGQPPTTSVAPADGTGCTHQVPLRTTCECVRACVRRPAPRVLAFHTTSDG
jgi:hypothetical protein